MSPDNRWRVMVTHHQDFGPGHRRQILQALGQAPTPQSFQVDFCRADVSQIKQTIAPFRPNLVYLLPSYAHRTVLDEFGGLVRRLKKTISGSKVAVQVDLKQNFPEQNGFFFGKGADVLITDPVPYEILGQAFHALLQGENVSHQQFIFPPKS